MSGIRTGIELNDGVTDVMNQIISSVNAGVAAVENMQQTLNTNVNTTAFDSVQSEIEATIASVNDLQSAMTDTVLPTISPNTAPVEPLDVPDRVQVDITPVVTQQPQVDVPDNVTVPVTPVITEQPQIETADEITVPVNTVVENQPEIEVPDGLIIPVTTEVIGQPQVEADEVSIPVTTVVENQPQIEVPDGLTVPVTAEVTQQPEIDVPDGVTVPVTTVVESQPQIEVPDEITVPVMAEVTQQPQINVPELDVSNVQQYSERIESVQNLLQQVSSIQQSINTQSQGLAVIPDDMKGQITTVNAQLERMQQELNMIQDNPFNFSSEVVEQQIIAVTNELRNALNVQRQLSDSLSHMDIEIEQPPPVEVPVEPQVPTKPVEVPVDVPTPDPVQIPVVWQSDNLDVFTSTGVDRFRQEVSSANTMLERLSGTQDAIARQAYNTNIFPPEMFQDLNSLAVRIDNVRDRIQQIENNPVNLGTDTANTELERLRSQLNQAISAQNDLNSAMDRMDIGDANSAYMSLSQTISSAEQYIRDNVDEQGRFNQEIQEGASQADNLTNTIRGAVAAYVSIQSVGKALDISDELVQTTSRLNMMNDGIQTTEELVNMVYAAAQDARGSFAEMAGVVARFGNNAKDAFGSSEEVVAFANLIQKQMTIAGASTNEAANAMLQLSQGLGSGTLRGDELNSIFEQAPNLIQNIADYLEVPIGEIREMASEGELTADIVKAAIFSAADDINSKFEQMPMTWGQVWQSMQNTAMIAFQPVLQRLNDIADSEAFQSFVNGAIEAMATLANIVLNIFDLIGQVGGFIADNWAIISPIVYGVIAALAVYGAYLGIIKGIEIASAAASAVMAVGKGLVAAATVIATGATWTQTTAQMGLNSAMYACPIVWIILLIIALIAVIFAVCNAIAKMTGIANSGFGVITGGINVVIQFFKNLGLTVANIALGIGNAIAALGSNMMTAFHNAIASVQSWFYDLLSTACSVIAGIAAELNKLPFVEFDYSGITSAAADYAAKSAAAAGSKEDYTSISDAFSEGMSTFDTFQSGWASDAFNAGASWGDGIADKVSNFSLSDIFGSTDIPNVEDYTSGFEDVIANSGIGDGVGSIADDAGAIKDSLDVTEEDLKYLRDIAEQEAVNRFTVAEVKIEQTNNNNISSDMDLDGIVSGLDDAMGEAIEIITEGVHD